MFKIAILFHIARYAKNNELNPNVIDADSLQWAIKHVEHCLKAVLLLDSISQRAAIKEEAETIYANIVSRFAEKAEGDAIILTKTELTNAFCRNPNRPSALKPNRLYETLIPHLIEKHLCKIVKQNGKVKFAFYYE